MGAYIYILKCSDGSYYIGSTRRDDVAERVAEHQEGKLAGYTSRRRPVTLVWSEYFERIVDAIAMERRIKGWTRAKKEALIGGEWSRLEYLAKRRSGKPR